VRRDEMDESKKCPKCKGYMYPTVDYTKEGKNPLKKCANCGETDYLNGTYPRKILRRLKEELSKKDPASVPKCLRSHPKKEAKPESKLQGGENISSKPGGEQPESHRSKVFQSNYLQYFLKV
jgi:DNA-directed RNA polymerase subunit M/transcription elongation factor TFIIS